MVVVTEESKVKIEGAQKQQLHNCVWIEQSWIIIPERTIVDILKL